MYVHTHTTHLRTKHTYNPFKTKHTYNPFTCDTHTYKWVVCVCVYHTHGLYVCVHTHVCVSHGGGGRDEEGGGRD